MQMVKGIMVQTDNKLSELIPKRGNFVNLNVHVFNFNNSECKYPVTIFSFNCHEGCECK